MLLLLQQRGSCCLITWLLRLVSEQVGYGGVNLSAELLGSAVSDFGTNFKSAAWKQQLHKPSSFTHISPSLRAFLAVVWFLPRGYNLRWIDRDTPAGP